MYTKDLRLSPCDLKPLNRCYAGRYKWGVLRQRSAQIMTAKQTDKKFLFEKMGAIMEFFSVFVFRKTTWKYVFKRPHHTQ